MVVVATDLHELGERGSERAVMLQTSADIRWQASDYLVTLHRIDKHITLLEEGNEFVLLIQCEHRHGPEDSSLYYG
ncbi:MAG: hypothetical protein Tsb0020_10800 [Haliangiales bacterium]